MLTAEEMQYEFERYRQLIGKTVEAVAIDRVTPQGPWFGLKFTDGTTVWALADAERNGPGHMEIIPPNKNN